MPLVRERITALLGVEVDLNADPMTAVATGAAIFAEGLEWSQGKSNLKSSRASVLSKGPINVRYDFPARTSDTHIRVKVKLDPTAQVTGFMLQAETEDGWSSGRLALTTSAEIREIPVNHRGINIIRITIFDGLGTPISEAVQNLTVIKTDASSEGMPLTHSIAVKILGGTIGSQINTLHTLVAKGRSVPVSGSEQLRAARDMKGGDGSKLNFELFEQVDDVDDPNLNLSIGVFQLDANTDLEKGDVIRRGDFVGINWRIDTNGLLSCKIEIPSISKTYDAGQMYVDTEGHKNFDGVDGYRLAVDALESAQTDIDKLERVLGSLVAQNVSALRERMRKQSQALKLSNEADTRRSVSEETRSIRQEVFRLENKTEFAREVLRSQIDGYMESYDVHLAPDFEDKVNSQIKRLAGMAKDALQKDNVAGVEDARHSLNEIRSLVFDGLKTKPDFWKALFEDFPNSRHQAINKDMHDRLIVKGRLAIENKDIEALKEAVASLSKNLVKSATPSRVDALSGLMK